MSLINQVLQDLEKRHASEPELRSLPPHVRAIPAGRRQGGPRTGRVAGAILLLVALAVAVLYYFLGGRLTPGPEPAPVGDVPQVAQAPVVPASPAPVLPAQIAEPVLLPPAARLSDELSFVPERPVAEDPPVRAGRNASLPPPAPLPLRVSPEPAAPIASEDVPVQRPVVRPAPQAEPLSAPAPPAAEVSIDKQVREMPPQQRAEVIFRKGVAQLQEGRAAAAETSFREALQEDQTHAGARQALLGLLLDAKRNADAEQLLRRALELNPRQPRHAMVLARLEVDRGDVVGAVNTLVGALPYVQSDPEYYAFLAALLQREGRHRETVEYYRSALQLSPGNPLWLMGMGISLRATNQLAEARDSFQRALDTRQLGGELQTFTERQLRELSNTKK